MQWFTTPDYWLSRLAVQRALATVYLIGFLAAARHPPSPAGVVIVGRHLDHHQHAVGIGPLTAAGEVLLRSQRTVRTSPALAVVLDLEPRSG